MREIRLVKNASWLFVLQGINVLLPFVTVPYVTRVLGADQYGIFSIALNLATYFQLVIEYGFDLSASKKTVETTGSEGLERLATNVVAARLLLLAICFVITAVLALCSSINGVLLCCLLVLFTMLIGYAIQLNWLFIGLQDMKVVTISTAIARTLSVLLVFVMVASPSQLVLYAFLYSITYLLSGLLTHLFAWKRYGVRMGRLSLRGILGELRDGTPIFLSNAAGKIIGNVGVTVLGACRPASVVGSYAAILKIPQVMSMMFTPVSQALYPRVNEIRLQSRRAAVKMVVRVSLPIAGAFALVLIAIVVMRADVIELLFGAEYLECADAIVPLAFWVFFGIVNNFLGVQLLITLGYQRIYSILIICDSFLSLALNVFLGTKFGAMGVASAIAVSEIVLSIALGAALFAIARSSKKRQSGMGL